MTDPLPSWREGAAKQAIVSFVEAVTKEGGSDFLPPAERIATFDNDGTLWCEHPMLAQVYFAKALLERLAAEKPELRADPKFKPFLDRDVPAIFALGKRGILEVVARLHAGTSEERFQAIAREWLADARHPVSGRLFTQMTYQPQLELLGYLRANGFMVFIVSGGGIDLIRSFSEEVYGIPRSQVVGSWVKTEVQDQGGVSQLGKLAELGCFDDREAKVQNIGLHIGRRPVFAFGNSDGDMAMLHYTKSGGGRRLALLVHHDDAEREYAYDREFRLSPLGEALDRADELGFQLVSMKRDWARVFSDPA